MAATGESSSGVWKVVAHGIVGGERDVTDADCQRRLVVTEHSARQLHRDASEEEEQKKDEGRDTNGWSYGVPQKTSEGQDLILVNEAVCRELLARVQRRRRGSQALAGSAVDGSVAESIDRDVDGVEEPPLPSSVHGAYGPPWARWQEESNSCEERRKNRQPRTLASSSSACASLPSSPPPPSATGIYSSRLASTESSAPTGCHADQMDREPLPPQRVRRRRRHSPSTTTQQQLSPSRELVGAAGSQSESLVAPPLPGPPSIEHSGGSSITAEPLHRTKVTPDVPSATSSSIEFIEQSFYSAVAAVGQPTCRISPPPARGANAYGVMSGDFIDDSSYYLGDPSFRTFDASFVSTATADMVADEALEFNGRSFPNGATVSQPSDPASPGGLSYPGAEACRGYREALRRGMRPFEARLLFAPVVVHGAEPSVPETPMGGRVVSDPQTGRGGDGGVREKGSHRKRRRRNLRGMSLEEVEKMKLTEMSAYFKQFKQQNLLQSKIPFLCFEGGYGTATIAVLGVILIIVGTIVFVSGGSVVLEEFPYTVGDTEVVIELKESIEPPFVLYVKLHKFWKNSRNFGRGGYYTSCYTDFSTAEDADRIRDPATLPELTVSGDVGIFPCGMSAFTYFNDRFDFQELESVSELSTEYTAPFERLTLFSRDAPGSDDVEWLNPVSARFRSYAEFPFDESFKFKIAVVDEGPEVPAGNYTIFLPENYWPDDEWDATKSIVVQKFKSNFGSQQVLPGAIAIIWGVLMLLVALILHLLYIKKCGVKEQPEISPRHIILESEERRRKRNAATWTPLESSFADGAVRTFGAIMEEDDARDDQDDTPPPPCETCHKALPNCLCSLKEMPPVAFDTESPQNDKLDTGRGLEASPAEAAALHGGVAALEMAGGREDEEDESWEEARPKKMNDDDDDGDGAEEGDEVEMVAGAMVAERGLIECSEDANDDDDENDVDGNDVDENEDDENDADELEDDDVEVEEFAVKAEHQQRDSSSWGSPHPSSGEASAQSPPQSAGQDEVWRSSRLLQETDGSSPQKSSSSSSLSSSSSSLSLSSRSGDDGESSDASFDPPRRPVAKSSANWTPQREASSSDDLMHPHEFSMAAQSQRQRTLSSPSRWESHLAGSSFANLPSSSNAETPATNSPIRLPLVSETETVSRREVRVRSSCMKDHATPADIQLPRKLNLGRGGRVNGPRRRRRSNLASAADAGDGADEQVPHRAQRKE